MNNRSRSRAGRSYTARLQRRKAYRPPRTWPTWLTGRHTPALLALIAEAGHLTAVLIEWPAATPRGAFHVLAAGLLGAVAVTVYFGASRLGVGLGLAATMVIPACWLAGTIAGIAPYRDYPLPAAAALTVVELAAAALLAAALRVTPQQQAAPVADPGRGRRSQPHRAPA